MSETNGFSDDSLDTSNPLNQGLTLLSEVENTDGESEFESSYIDPIEKESSSLDDLVQNIDRLDQSSSSDTSELTLFAQSEPLILDAAVADEEQPEELDSLTGSEIDLSRSAFSATTPTNLNQSIFTNGESTRITLEFIQREAAFRNEVGLYRVDDATGSIGDLLPGDNGYAAAALDPARRIITLDNGAASVQFSAEIEPDTLFGSYLIQNDTSHKFLKKNSGNRVNKKPLAFFSFKESNPDNFDHLQTRINDSGSIDLAWEDWTGGGDQDFTDSVFTISFDDTPINTTPPNYAVRAEGQLKLRGRGDYDGEPLNLDDDVLIYAGEGFNLAGKPILPVKRDETGNPLVDGQNKQILVDDAITVAPGYSTGKATQSIKHQYSGLTPPQMVESQTVDVPDYDVVKQEQVDTAIGDASQEVTLAASTSLNNTSQWSNDFPAPGTPLHPTVVRVQRQGLTIPHQVDLSNYVIIVERGDIKFQGSNHELDNVVLIAEQGKIDLGQVEIKDSSLLAAKSIKVRSNTKFTGDNLIANSQGKIEFYNSQSELDTEDNIRVIAAGDLSIRGRSTLKGEFLTTKDFLAQGRTSVYGSVGAKGDVTFNGRVEMHAIPSSREEIRATIDSATVAEDSGVATVTVSLSAPSEEVVSVDFATSNDTAQAGTDYQTVNSTISFAPGETVKTIEIPILNDEIYEGDEALAVELTNPNGIILDSDQAVVNITNDDPLPEIVIDHPSHTELDTETENIVFTVSLSNPSSLTVTVDYTTEDNTAVAGSDYLAQTGTLTFEPGETSKTIEVPIIGDLEVEPDELFQVVLSNPVSGVISEEDGIGTGTISNNDIPPIELNLNLTNDTGVNNTDNISTDATISGTITNLQGDIGLSASFDDLNSADFSDLVQPDGSFTLGIEQLEQINGGDLDDGNYTLYVVATDSGTGVVRNSILTFVLDRTAPTLELTTPLVDGDHSSRPRLIGSTESNDIAKVSYSLDGGEAEVITVDDTGNFDSNLDDGELDTGTHSVTVTATDTAGNQSNREVSFQVGDSFFTPHDTKGWGAQNDSALILGEQDSYIVETRIPVALGLDTNDEGEQVGTRTISFDLDAVWSDLDKKAIEDQLLVYLVDPANPSQTLLDNGTEGTAVFSLAGEQSDFTPGIVSFDGRTVTIDASSLTDVEQGLLVFQLLNQDDDTGSVVTVNNLASTTDLEGFVNPIFPEDNSTVAVGQALNLDNLTATTDVETIIDNVRFDASTGEYKAQVSIQNNGEPISRNTAVLFNDLPEGVELLEPSGTDSTGNPYLNLRPAILPGGLDTGAISGRVEVVFRNPNLVPLGLDTTVLVGSPNAAPIFEPIGNLTVVPGKKLELDLAATDPDGDNVTYRLDADDDLPTGMLEGNGTLKFNPQPDELGSYEFTIIATDGAESVSQTVTLDVVADPITTTRISGVIENVEQQPLAGVVIELGDLETVTNADGSFTLETDQPLTDDTLKVRGEGIEGDQVYPFIAEKLPLVLGQEVYEGFHNYIDRPIYLPALDVASGQVIDPSVDATVTTENIPGASVFVEAGSLSTQEGETFTGTLSITEVPTDLTPAALPENLSPDMVITIQPGEMVFETPAPLSLPNRAGWAAGMEMDLWSINPETGDFDNVGTGRVSDDGSIIETIEGGIRNSSWHFWSPPPEEQRDPEEDIRNEDNKCPDCKASGGFNSEVEYHSGAVIETHNLTTYSSNGSDRGITLTYDSLRADPRPIIHFGYDNVSNLNPGSKLIADLTVQGNGFEYQIPGYEGKDYGLDGGEHFWSIPSQSGNLSVGLQADMRELPSGLYDYTVNSGVYLLSNNLFTGSSSDEIGDFIHVNTIDSDFGSGWSISGWQELVENSDGSVLLIDGDGGELLFEVSDEGNESYISPPGDFSTLEKLTDGTFKRTMKDQMVYIFNSDNQLESITDRNGNQTKYVYGDEQQLSKIVDSVGLETLFTYNEAGLVSSIIDPAKRTTKLEYDQAGNLTRIIDPDDTARTWSYDDNRHMVSEIDQRENKEQAFYDSLGRARDAILKDGSTVKVNPLSTQGVYSSEATVAPLSAPLALIENEEPIAAYADGKGNVTQTEVDRSGQLVKALDAQGNLPSVERNEQNLITAQTNARDFDISYIYDDRGNVVKTTQEVTTNRRQKDIFPSPFINLNDNTDAEILLSEDLNNDGQSDLVFIEKYGDTINVLLSVVDGSFLPAVQYELENPIGSKPVVGDFNNDGLLDLVLNIYAPGAIKIMFNQGNGDFSLDNPNSIDINLPDADNIFNSDRIFDLTTGDFDNDGLLDIVSYTFSAESNGIYLHINQGDGSFTNSKFELNKVPINNSYRLGKHINAVDLNNDDWLDVVLNAPGLGGGILFGNENGTFDQGNYEPEIIGYPASTIVVDLNKDNQEDLLVLDGVVKVSLGKENGDFEDFTNYPISIKSPVNSDSIDLGDFNNDGNIDVVSSNKGSTSILFGLGDGTFSEPVEQTETISFAGETIFGYFDSDEWLDLARLNRDLGISIFNNQENEIFEERLETNISQNSEHFSIVNLNSDEFPDLVTTDSLNNKVTSFLGNGAGIFSRLDEYELRSRPYGVTLGDFNGDGLNDLATINSNYPDAPEFSVLWGEVDGTFNSEPNYYAYGEPRTFPRTIIAEDFNNDGLSDLLIYAFEWSTSFSVLLAQEDKTFAPEVRFEKEASSELNIVDIDGDNNLDIVAGKSYENGFFIFYGDGNGNFADAVDYPLSSGVDTFTVSDLNNDGRKDVIAGKNGESSFFTILNTGDRTFSSEVERDFGFNLKNYERTFKSEDINNDDLSDLIVLGDSSVYVLLGKGDGTFSPNKNYFAGYQPEKFAIEDIDNNSYQDIVTLGEGFPVFISERLQTDFNHIAVQLNQLDDSADLSLFERQYTYDPIFNQVTSETDELGHQTLYDIDPNNGNLLSTTRVVGEVGGDDDVVTSYTYTDAGLVDTMTDPLGRVTNYEYDRFGRIIRETYALGTADQASVSYEYDLAGNQTAVIDENGNRTEYKYDQKNRVIEIIEADPDGEGELISPVSTFDYDKSGNLIETIDGKNNATQHQYDELDRKTKTIDSLRQETTYEYDNVGNVIAVIDAAGRKTENIYDSRSRLIKTIDPEGNSTKYQYDLDDNVVAVIDSLGNITRNFYDNRDRLERTIDAESNVTSYEYDAADNLIAVVDANKNRTEYEYDELNRQIKQIDALLGESTTVYDKVSNVISTKDEEKRITNLVYDNRDRLISTTDAENGVASFEYDSVGNLIVVTDEENRPTNFTYDALNRQIEINAPLTQKTSTTYDAVGNVTAVTDANDHSTYFTYDKLNRQTVITNHLGDTVKTKYDKVGNVTAVTDELNRTTRFTYDKRNLQTSIIDPLDHTFTREYDAVGNVSSVTDARNNTTRYEYDKLYRLIKEIDANNESITYNYDPVGNLLDFTDELKRTTKFAYDQLNRQTTVTDPLTHVTRSAYDKVGNLISLTDANEHSTYFTYDKLNRQTVATNHLRDTVKTEYDKVGNVTAITDELDRTTYFQYDQLNRQISVKDPLTHLTQLDYDLVGNLTAVTDANKHTTRYEYDELNRQTDIINPFGDTFKTEYDAVGNVTAVTDELKRRTEFAYDKRNLQTSVTNALKNVTRTEYDQVGNVSSVTDANDHTTRYQYDKLNRQTIITNDAGETIETEYDAVDNVIAITDELKRTTKFAYDKRNRQISVTDPLTHTTTSVYDPVGNLLSVRDANQHITSYGYDELNRIISITDHLNPNQPSTFTYDKVGNLILSTDELNRTSTYTYDKLNRQLSFTNDNQQTTTNTYDPVGNLLTVTDPLNLTTHFDYDKLNRQISVTNPNTETTRYTYDKVGNQLSITDPEKNTTSYTYDKLNRLLTDTNQLGKTFTYQYDKVGNVLKTTDRNGREIDFVYDNLNRNTAEIWLDESGNAIRNINLQYDAANQLLNASDPDSAYSYDYDLDGRLISVDNANTPGVPNVVLNYTYDPVDNLTQVKDSINGVDKGIETFTYDELDRVTKITQSGEGVSDKRIDLSYDAASQMSEVARYSDLAGIELIADSTYTFDQASRLIDLTHQQNETTLAEFGLVYDKGDRITQFTTPDGAADFSYDDSDQLVDANYENQADENYSYDDNGNRTNAGYVTGDNNQLLSDGIYDYEYDNEGNRTKQIEIATGVVTEYEWDHRNRLVAVVTKDLDGNVTADVSYTYDVFDNRISKSVDADGDGAGEAVVERYVLDGDHIALTFDGEGNLTERFLHGLQIDQILARENADGEVLWALTDHQNSVRVVLDNNGDIVNQISYDSFGQIINETHSDIDFHFSYTGREYDGSTGNYYYRARYYDPSAGRFISEDPISFAAGDSNIYRYVGNNPLFYLDPSGFCGVSSSGGPGSFGGPDFFGPGFGPGFSPGSNSGPGSNNNGDFWNDVSESVFGEPASAGTLPTGLIPPPTNPAEKEQRRILREREREQREDNPLEQGLERTRKFIEDTFERIVDDIDLRDDFRRQIENPDSIEPLIDIFVDIDGDSQTQQPEQTTISEPGAFDPNGINRDQQESEPLTEQRVTPPLDRNLDLENPIDGIPVDNDTGIEVETFPQGNDGLNDGLTVDRFDVDIEVTDSQGNPIFGPGYIGNDFPVNDSQIRHILRDRPGHISDTPENRQILRDLANNYHNYLGPDSYGNSWFAKTMPDGKQVWVRTRDGIINNAGVNDISDTRTYNPETGLNRRTPPRGN